MSDWAALTITEGDNVVVVQDYGIGSDHSYDAVTGSRMWYQAASASYNQANPGGSWSDNGALDVLISKIEVY